MILNKLNHLIYQLKYFNPTIKLSVTPFHKKHLYKFSTQQGQEEALQENNQIVSQQQQLQQQGQLSANNLEGNAQSAQDQEVMQLQKDSDYLQRVQNWSLVGKHLLLDKFHFNTKDISYYYQMQQKIIDYEQQIGLSLTNLQNFPLVSKQRKAGRASKVYRFQSQENNQSEKQSLKKQIIQNSLNRQHYFIHDKVIRYFISLNEIQILQVLRKTGAFSANKLINLKHCTKLIDAFFKLKKQNQVSNPQMILNYIPYENSLLLGYLSNDALESDYVLKLLLQFPHINGKVVDKIRLAWSLIKLQHQVKNISQVNNQKYSQETIRYLLRQLPQIGYASLEQKSNSLRQRLNQNEKYKKNKIKIQQQLHKLIFISCGQSCMIPIVNWMINYFPTYESFRKNISLILALFYLLQNQSVSQNMKSKSNKDLYLFTILNMIRNNQIYNEDRQKIFEYLVNQVIPSALYNHGRNQDLFNNYKQILTNWQSSIQKNIRFRSFSSSHLIGDMLSLKTSNPFLKLLFQSIESGEINLKNYQYKNPNSPKSIQQNIPSFTTISQKYQTKSKIKDNNKTITQTQFVKALIGQKYSMVYEYFKRHFKNDIDLPYANACNQDQVSKLYHFQNDDVKAFYILWQYSKALKYQINLRNLYKSDLQVKQIKEKTPKKKNFKKIGQKSDNQEIQQQLMQQGDEAVDFQSKISSKQKQQDINVSLQRNQIQHIQRIQKPKKYRTASKQPKMMFKKRDFDIHQPPNQNNTQQLENLIDGNGNNNKPKYRNNDRGYQQHDKSNRNFIKNKSHFSTLNEKKIDAYQQYKQFIKQVQDSKIFNFENCKTIQDIENQFKSKKHLLNKDNYKEVINNNKVPIIKKGEKLFKFFFLNSQSTSLQQSQNKQQIKKINNLQLNIQAQIGLIEKDYNQYLNQCSFMFPFDHQTYISLLQDQLKKYHRKSFKIIIAHKVAFASIAKGSNYHLDNRFIELMCQICLKQKVGITLLQIAYLFYINSFKLSQNNLQKICSTLYSFNSMREDAFQFAQKYCLKSGLKFKVTYFKSYCLNLINNKKYDELQLLANQLLSQLKEKPYKFDAKLSNDDNQLLQKQWKEKQKLRYIDEVYEMLDFLSDSVQNQVPQFISQLFQLYLQYKENKNNLTTNQYHIALIAYSFNQQKFNQILKNLKNQHHKITPITLSVLIKALSIYPKKLAQHLQQVLKMTLYDKNFDIKQGNLLKLAQIFVKVDKPMIFGTFLEFLIKNSQEISDQSRKALYDVLTQTEDDQSKEHIFGLLSLMFDKTKQKQKIQYQKTLKQQQSKRKNLQNMMYKSKRNTKLEQIKSQTKINSPKPQKVVSVKQDNAQSSKNKKQKGQKAPQQIKKVDGGQAKGSSSQTIINEDQNIKKKKKIKENRIKSTDDILDLIKRKSKGQGFDENITFQTYQKTNKRFKRSITMKNFAQAYLLKQRVQQDPKKKKATKGNKKQAKEKEK